MSITKPRITSGSITLHFTGRDLPSLNEVLFTYDPILNTIRSIRGRTGGAFSQYASFLWSPAVRALSVLILKNLCKELAGSPLEHGAGHGAGHGAEHGAEHSAALSGEGGSLASSLDYACSKNTAWLADMFGVDPDGVPYARKLLLRTNPERKRPGPVTISLNRLVIDPKNIQVWLDGNRLADKDSIQFLIDAVERSHVTSRGFRGPVDSIEIHQKSREMTHPLEEGAHRSGFGSLPIARYHYLVEPESLRLEYAHGLELGFFDRRFAFFGEGAAQVWQDLVSSPHYSYYHDSLKVLQGCAQELASVCPGLAHFIVDIPGNGVKEKVLFEAFPKEDGRTICLVDSSHEMLRLAAPQAAAHCDRLELFYCNGRIPGELTRIRSYLGDIDSRPVAFMALGNFFSAHYQRQVLVRLHDAMRPGDRFITDVWHHLAEDDSNIQEIFENRASDFDTPEFHRHVMITLRPLGVDFDDGGIELEYERDPIFPFAFRIAQYFVFKRPKVVSYNGRTYHLMKGTRIRLLNYLQYSKKLFTEIVTQHGFEIDWEYDKGHPVHFYSLRAVK